ncbi:MAG: hypothetical protein L0H39_08235, partial [Brachybacterium sp.]|nr:hypothetical protein [Brachybacterium sp.]
MSTQSTPAAATPLPRTHRTRTLVLVAAAAALVVGLIGLGIGGVGGALLSGSLGSADSRTDQDLADGCAILDRVEGELPLTEESLDVQAPLFFELLAASQLFMAAGVGEDDLELQMASSELLAGMNRVDIDQANEAIET